MHRSGLIVILFFWMSRVGFSQAITASDPHASHEALYRHAVAIANSKLDSGLYYFEAYKKALLPGDSVIRKRSISFYNYAGSVYLHQYLVDSTLNQSGLKKAMTFLDKVIAIDSTNLSANVNLMTVHYNRGVWTVVHGNFCKQRELIENTDWNKPDSEIPSLAKLLECIRPEEYEKYHILPPFKAALPYALRAYRQDPENRKVLEALQGIYMVLSDKKQANVYKAKLEVLQKSKR